LSFAVRWHLHKNVLEKQVRRDAHHGSRVTCCGTLPIVKRRGLSTLISGLTAGALLCTCGGPSCAAPPAAANNFPPVLVASGEISCGQFIEDQRADNTALMNLFVQWVWSFLIDHHEFVDVKPGKASGRVDLPGQATVLLFLTHFCEHNPSSKVYSGTVALLQSRRRSGLSSTQAVITGRMRVRKTMRRPIGS
jgi:hypothetical protein